MKRQNTKWKNSLKSKEVIHKPRTKEFKPWKNEYIIHLFDNQIIK